MEMNKTNMEEFFRKGFDNFAVKPSEMLLKRLRFRLWVKDFLSFNFKVFNIGYVLVAVTGITLPVLLISNSKPENASEVQKGLMAEKPVVAEENGFDTITIEENDIADLSVIEENNIPSISFEPSVTQGCLPLIVEFKNNTRNAEKYYWDFGNGETSVKKNPKVRFAKEGQYTITLKATSASGIRNTLKQTVIVYPKPVAVAEIDIENSDMKTRRVSFLNKSKAASSYLWSFGDNITSANSDAVHVYRNNGKYKVTLIAFSAYGCSDTTVIENSFIEKNYDMSFPPKFRPGTYNSQNSGFYENAAEQNFIFFPLNNGAKSYELKIFAPNGIEVFKTTNVKQGWNGFIKGRVAPPGRYSFVAKGIYPNGKKFEIKSHVDVIVDEVNGYY